MNSKFRRVLILLRRYRDHLITILCVAVIFCGLIAWAFDLVRAWEIFGIGAVVAVAAILAAVIF